MNPLGQLKVFVELGSPEEPIRGEVEAPPGKRTAFSGWIGLVAAIEAARMSAPVEPQPIARGGEAPETPHAQDGLAGGAGRERRELEAPVLGDLNRGRSAGRR